MTYKEIEEKYPYLHQERKLDKLGFRYPRGESYLDLIQRIEPVIFEIERSTDPVIVIAHQAVLRCLYAYFTNNDKSIINKIPLIDIPLNTVFLMQPSVYYTKEVQYTIDLETGNISKEKLQAFALVKRHNELILI